MSVYPVGLNFVSVAPVKSPGLVFLVKIFWNNINLIGQWGEFAIKVDRFSQSGKIGQLFLGRENDEFFISVSIGSGAEERMGKTSVKSEKKRQETCTMKGHLKD